MWRSLCRSQAAVPARVRCAAPARNASAAAAATSAEPVRYASREEADAAIRPVAQAALDAAGAENLRADLAAKAAVLESCAAVAGRYVPSRELASVCTVDDVVAVYWRMSAVEAENERVLEVPPNLRFEQQVKSAKR